MIELETQVHSAAAAGSVLHSSQGRTPRRLGRRRSGRRDVVCRAVIPFLAFTGTSAAANNRRSAETNPLIPPPRFSPKAVRGMSCGAVPCQVWPSSSGIHSTQAIWDANGAAKGCARSWGGQEGRKEERKEGDAFMVRIRWFASRLD